ncbi:hypothetical protein JCM5353_001755 [Sporobolomyces roseus]
MSQHATATTTRTDAPSYTSRAVPGEITESRRETEELQKEESSYNSTAITSNKQVEKIQRTASRSVQGSTTAQTSIRRSQPKNTADSSFASTSKLSLPPSPSSPSTSPTPTPYPSATSHLSTAALPNSERTLFLLLRQLHSTYPSIPPSWYLQFHSQPYFVPFVSSRTYTFLLDLGFKRSNLWIVEEVLIEMERREIGLDEKGLRVLLRGYRGVGNEKKWRDVLERLENVNRGGREWIVEGRSTKRLDLGSKGKGKAKEMEQAGEMLGGEGVGWKGWTMRARDSEALDEGGEVETRETLRSNGGRAVNSTHRTRIKKKPAAPRIPPQRRPRVLIPPHPHRLSASSATNLVQLLVSDQRTHDAFSLADTWLARNRPTLPSNSPSTSSPSPTLITLTHSYNSTLLVFVNILLKPLLLARSSISQILSFPSTFIARHAPPLPLPQPSPGLSTIREILCGLTGTSGKSSWNRGTRVIDHFGYRWGLPIGDDGFEGEERMRFRQPKNPHTRERLCLDPLSDERDSGKGLVVKPHTVTPPSVSILLLQLAVESHSQPLTRLSSDHVKEFREWWKGVSEKEQDSDWLKGSKVGSLLTQAGETGLLDKGEKSSRRREWHREQKLYVSRRKGGK